MHKNLHEKFNGTSATKPTYHKTKIVNLSRYIHTQRNHNIDYYTALMAPSLNGLQKLSATESYCQKWDIMLNAKKTKNVCFGKLIFLPQLQLDGKKIDWVDSWTYFG